MGLADEIWALERRCWVEGKEYYEGIITADSVYAFPAPMGIFKGAGFVSQMGDAGPCERVEFSNQNFREFNNVCVLVYEGTGIGADGSVKRSNCTSVWEHVQGKWKLAAHHQTPLDSEDHR